MTDCVLSERCASVTLHEQDALGRAFFNRLLSNLSEQERSTVLPWNDGPITERNIITTVAVWLYEQGFEACRNAAYTALDEQHNFAHARVATTQQLRDRLNSRSRKIAYSIARHQIYILEPDFSIVA
jgi:hypothetical protein